MKILKDKCTHSMYYWEHQYGKGNNIYVVRVCSKCNHMTQTSEKWIKEFNEKINKHYFVLPDSHLNVVGIRSFIREAISTREKEIANEVKKLGGYSNFKEEVLKILNHNQ